MAENEKLDEPQEMFLERVWCLRENGKNSERAVIGTTETQARHSFLDEFKRSEYLLMKDNNVDFTQKGEKYTRDLIRRRRLTEVLLNNVLQLDMDTVETSACKIEHIINDEVTDSICAFLGHPVACPHGKSIPPGQCCGGQEKGIKPLIEPITNFTLGSAGRVVFIASKDSGILRRLTSLGIHPGAVVNLRQQQPTAVLRVGETDIALEPELIEQIYCRSLCYTFSRKDKTNGKN